MAWWRPGMDRPKGTTIDMPDTRDIGIWSNAFRQWALPFMKMQGVTHVASEAPMLAVHLPKDEQGDPIPGRRGHIDMNVVVFHVGILVTIEQVRAELELPPVRRCVRSSVALHFTGSGKGKRDELKRRCIVQCQSQGWPVTDDNLADACGVLDYFCWENKAFAETPWNCAPRKGLPLSAERATVSGNRTEDRTINRIANAGMRLAKGAA